MLYDLLQAGIKLFYHYYFEDGHSFAYPIGQFPQWALLAPEEGSFSYKLKDESGTVSFGSVLFCPPHTALRRAINGTMTYHVVAFDVAPAAAVTLPIGAVTIQDTVRLSATFHHLRALPESDSKYSRAARTHLLLDILYLIEKEKHNLQSVARQKKTPDHSLLLARQKIEEQAFTNLSLHHVAKEVRLSPVQLTRRFREAFGQTPIAFLTALRISRARSLLIASDLTLREIARQCGFSSEHYFSRVFFQATQMRPGEFRRLRRL